SGSHGQKGAFTPQWVALRVVRSQWRANNELPITDCGQRTADHGQSLVPKKLLITLLKYGLGFGLLAWVVYANWDGENGLGQALEKPIRVAPLILATVICLTSVLLTFVRWYILVRAQDLPFAFPNALRLGLVGYFFNTMLPGSVGGDLVKATFLAREQSRRTVAVATVLLDRAVGLCGLFWLAAILGGIFWATGGLHEVARSDLAVTTLETIVIVSAAIMAASLIFWILLGLLPFHRAERFAGRLARFPKIGHQLAEFWRAVWIYRCRGRAIGIALLLAIVGHAGFVLTFYFAAQVLTPLSEIPTVGPHYLIVPARMTIQASFPTPRRIP